MSKITVFKINLPTSLFLSILLFQVLIKDACGSFSISWKQMKTKLTSNYEIVLLCFCRRIWLTWILYIIKAHTQENSFYIQKKLWHKILSVRLLVIKLVFLFLRCKHLLWKSWFKNAWSVPRNTWPSLELFFSLSNWVRWRWQPQLAPTTCRICMSGSIRIWLATPTRFTCWRSSWSRWPPAALLLASSSIDFSSRSSTSELLAVWSLGLDFLHFGKFAF